MDPKDDPATRNMFAYRKLAFFGNFHCLFPIFRLKNRLYRRFPVHSGSSHSRRRRAHALRAAAEGRLKLLQ